MPILIVSNRPKAPDIQEAHEPPCSLLPGVPQFSDDASTGYPANRSGLLFGWLRASS